MKEAVFSLFSLASCLLFVGVSSQAQCGSEVGGALCPGGLCCSQWGYCGGTIDYCGQGCQSQCGSTTPPPPTPVPTPPTPTPSPPTPPSPSGGDDVSSLMSESLFNEFLKHRSTPPCPGGFYTYTGFITATRSFDGFGTTGNIETRKRELAAFFGQTSHETTGGWETAEDGPYAWGYCFIQEVGNPGEYCQSSLEWPCVSGQKYYGRGPMQLSWNYNYGQAGQALGLDLLNNPDLLVTDPVIAFKAALWFWMTPQAPKPSSHDVITGLWTPSPADIAAGRLPGYGVITNIINGGLECGIANDPRVESRIGFYTRYCGLLGVSLGENLYCANQRPFGYSLSASF